METAKEAAETTQPENDFKPMTLTRKEASKRLGLSESMLDHLTKAGKLGHCRVGRRVLYLERHMEEFLALAERKAKAA